MTNEAKCLGCRRTWGSNPHCKECVWGVTQGLIQRPDGDGVREVPAQGTVVGGPKEANEESRRLRALLCSALGMKLVPAELTAVGALEHAVNQAVEDLDLLAEFLEAKGVDLREEELLNGRLAAVRDRLQAAQEFAAGLPPESGFPARETGPARAAGEHSMEGDVATALEWVERLESALGNALENAAPQENEGLPTPEDFGVLLKELTRAWQAARHIRLTLSPKAPGGAR